MWVISHHLCPKEIIERNLPTSLVSGLYEEEACTVYQLNNCKDLLQLSISQVTTTQKSHQHQL